jgi:hypothetical protein
LIPFEKNDHFYFDNESFGIGDADVYYSMIRHLKPNNVVEIGGGFSTQLARLALNKNFKENEDRKGNLICIEPYEFKYLRKIEVDLIRSRVEEVSINLFGKLDRNDIVFVDSSHIIKPKGDVLHEIFEILPNLKSGVYIHFHDIFTPFDYPEKWIMDEIRLWNEQYLLEGFLSFNTQFEIILSMSYLMNFHSDQIMRYFPQLTSRKSIPPSSLWIRKC